MAIPTKFQPFGNDNLEDKFLTFRAIESSDLKITMTGTVNISKLYYSKNNGDWTLYSINQVIGLNPRRQY